MANILTRALVVDPDVQHARRIGDGLRMRQVHADYCANCRDAIRMLRSNRDFEIVLFNLAPSSREVLECLRQLNATDIKFSRPARQIVCTAESFLEPALELDLEAQGARVIYER